MSEGKPFINCGKLHDFENAFFHSEEIDKIFIKAFNETLRWHVLRCPEYKSWLSAYGFTVFRQIYNPFDIPLLPVSIFENFALSSTSYDLVKFDFGSIAFSVQGKSHAILETRSWKRLLKILKSEIASLKFINSEIKHNYICFASDPELNINILEDFIFSLLTSQTAHRSVFYSYKNDSGNFGINWEQTLKRLTDFSLRPEPLLIIGSYAEIEQLCHIMDKEKIRVNLSNGSAIICLSGLDSNADFIDEELIKQIKKMLGIGRGKVRNMFWVKEQMLPLITCECGLFHVPVYTVADVFEPEYMQPVENGEPGLFGIISPFLTSYPAFSILTKFVAHKENHCSCGRSGVAFKIDEVVNV